MPKLVIVSQQEMNKTLSMGQKMTGISGRQMNTMNPADLFSLLPYELCKKISDIHEARYELFGPRPSPKELIDAKESFDVYENYMTPLFAYGQGYHDICLAAHVMNHRYGTGCHVSIESGEMSPWMEASSKYDEVISQLDDISLCHWNLTTGEKFPLTPSIIRGPPTAVEEPVYVAPPGTRIMSFRELEDRRMAEQQRIAEAKFRERHPNGWGGIVF